MTSKPIKQRIQESCKIDEDGCWIWQKYVNRNGYGQMMVGEGSKLSHRQAYMAWKGIVPDGMDLDHTCHRPSSCLGGPSCEHRRCCNPDHLEPVSRKENVRRGYGNQKVAAKQRAKTHCINGHPYDSQNTYITPKGWRGCKVCRATIERNRYQRKKATC